MQPAEESTEATNHVPHVLQLLNEGNDVQLRVYLNELHPVELVHTVNGVNREEQEQLIRAVTGLDQLSALMSYAGSTLRATTLSLLNDSRIAAIVRRLAADDAADIVGELPRRRQVSVLKRLSVVKAREITTLLAYDEQTAGGIMTTLFLKLPETTSASLALDLLRNRLRTEDIDPATQINYIYVVDSFNRLVGICSLRDVIAADTNKTVGELMEKNIVCVYPDEDQEAVASLFRDYGFTAIPVLSHNDDAILGIITVDDVIDVIEEEHTEDLFKLVGTEEEDTVGASITTAIKSRLPWLLVSWIGGICGALLLGSFSSTLEKTVALAFFMPVVFGMGGNLGAQSSTITVRGIAVGDLSRHRAWQRIRKESMVGIMLGCLFGLFLATAAFGLYGNPALGIVVGISIATTMICASTLGAMLPILFNRAGIDPAVASGPLVTTGTDILSISIYFSIASMLIR